MKIEKKTKTKRCP